MRCSIAVGTVCFLAYVELVVKDVDTLGILVVGCAVCNVDVAEELACWCVVDDKTASLANPGTEATMLGRAAFWLAISTPHANSPSGSCSFAITADWRLL